MSLKKLIQESLVNYSIVREEDCNCGCEECGSKMALLESKAPISEGLRYHIENGISLQENVFRIGSKKFLQLFAEARMLNEWGTIQLDENSLLLVENTNIGEFGILEGKRVPLDIPISISEQEQQIDEFLGKLTKKLTKIVGIQKLADIVLKNIADMVPEDKKELVLDLKPVITSAISMGKISTLKELFDYLMEHGGELKDTILELPWHELIKKRPKLTEGELDEAKKKKKKKKDPPIGKPMRDSSGGSAYKVYVRDPKTKNIKTIRFGSGGLRAKIKDSKARSAFAKRHRCSQKKDRTSAGYWSCNLPRYAHLLGLGNKMNTYW